MQSQSSTVKHRLSWLSARSVRPCCFLSACVPAAEAVPDDAGQLPSRATAGLVQQGCPSAASHRIVWHRSSSKAGQNANANLSVTEARHNNSGTSMLSMVSNPAVSHARPRHKLATPVNAIETANEFVGL